MKRVASILEEAPDRERTESVRLQDKNNHGVLMISVYLVPYLVAKGDLGVKLVK